MLSGRALRRAHQTAPAVADVPERTSFVKQRGVRLCDRLSRLPTATAGVMHRALHVTAPPPPQIFGDVYDVYGRSRRRPCYRPLHVMPPTVVLHSSVDNWGCARPFLEHFPEHGCSDGGKDCMHDAQGQLSRRGSVVDANLIHFTGVQEHRAFRPLAGRGSGRRHSAPDCWIPDAQGAVEAVTIQVLETQYKC